MISVPPLGIITNMTDFAFQDIDDKAKLTDDLKKISASNTFLLSLINDVLDISKIDSGKIELKPEPYLFSDYISNVRNMLEPLCQEKGPPYGGEDLFRQSGHHG
jgi:signal transduction histidine kinase